MGRARGARLLLGALLLGAAAVPVTSASVSADPALPPGFDDTTAWVAPANVAAPTSVAVAPDGQWFAGGGDGRVWGFSGPDDRSASLVADLRATVYTPGDHALTGLEVDPLWPREPYLYVAYTLDAPPGESAPYWNDVCPDPPGFARDGCLTQLRVSRLRIENGVQAGTERVLLQGGCYQYGSHATGSLRIGPDGALYAGSGDGASYSVVDWGQAGQPPNPCGDPPSARATALAPPTAEGGSLRAQDLETTGDPAGLNGVIVRVDRATGEPLPDNPRADDPDRVGARVIGYGFRNPFRFDIDPQTGKVIVGDVGAGSVEELNVIDPRGGRRNYGWPCYEGSGRMYSWDQLDFDVCESLYRRTDAVVSPVVSYRHGAADLPGCPASPQAAVTAVAVERGSAFPEMYRGAIFFADYVTGCMWWVPRHGDHGWAFAELAPFASGLVAPTDFEFGPDGALWYVAYGDCRCVRRIRAEGTDLPPSARVVADRTSGPLPLRVRFDARGSSDPEGDRLTFTWDLDGDGNYGDASGPTAEYTYEQRSIVEVSVRVTDTAGNARAATTKVWPGESGPVVALASPTANTTFAVGDRIAFAASASDEQDGALPERSFSWELTQMHCAASQPPACHAHLVESWDGTRNGSFVAPDHEFPSYLELSVVVTDSAGLSTRATVRIDPQASALGFTSFPPGAELTINERVVRTPALIGAIVGSTFVVSASPTISEPGGTEAMFVRWADDAPRTRRITASPKSSRYKFRYDQRPVLAPAIGTAAEREGTLVVPLLLDRPATTPVKGHFVVVPYTAAASDFERLEGTFWIGAGQQSGAAVLSVRDDDLPEDDEVALLVFDKVVGARLGGFLGLGLAVIRDDDSRGLGSSTE